MRECVVCGQAVDQQAYPGILRCFKCATMVADTSLSAEALKELYGRNYFFGEEYGDYIRDRRILEKNFNLRLKVLTRYLGDTSQKSLLEVGSAYGFFLNLVRERFKRVRGFDVSSDAVLYAQNELKLDVKDTNFLSHDFGQDRFDAVCLWDTLEHLAEPDRYLEKIANITPAGALLAFTTGDIESFNARWRGRNWRLLHPPTHLFYFSKKSINRLLKRYGFEVLYNRYCGFYRSLDQIAYSLFVLRRQKSRLYHWLKKSGIFQNDIYLNLYDIFYVVARKL